MPSRRFLLAIRIDCFVVLHLWLFSLLSVRCSIPCPSHSPEVERIKWNEICEVRTKHGIHTHTPYPHQHSLHPRVPINLCTCSADVIRNYYFDRTPMWSLPADFYTSKAVYDVDLEHIWRKSWLQVG